MRDCETNKKIGLCYKSIVKRARRTRLPRGRHASDFGVERNRCRAIVVKDEVIYLGAARARVSESRCRKV